VSVDPVPVRPPCVLVVGMHRSGTSATASTLAELGLALPRDEDLLGARFGNELGHFESQSLMGLSDEILGHIGRSWDDPPDLGEIGPEVLADLAGYGDRARTVFEAAFGAPDSPVVWKDPRTALLLPFWRSALDRPLATVLMVREPLEVAQSLDRRNSLAITTSLALWERYYRQSVAGIAGLPAFVSSFEDALDRPTEWRQELAGWLRGLGIPATLAKSSLDPAMRHERTGHDDEDSPVLPSQRAIFNALVGMGGPHDSFEPPDLGPESQWTESHLRHRHELGRLWSGFEWLGRQVADLVASDEPGAPHQPSDGYPKDATDDEQRYHEWLRQRGEPINVGSGPGIAPAATEPPHGQSPLFSVVVPTYRTPVWAIDRCVTSVLRQDFARWELVIVDDASGDRALLAHLQQIAASDSRISLSARQENGGISAATSDGIGRARGEYVVFLDHDDELAEGALGRLSAAIDQNPAAQLIYSDEDKIDEKGRRFMPAFKPAWSPDLLLSNAYMCHIFVVRRSLVAELGGIRSEFDGAQDYDLMLRATELLSPEEIVQVPEILYHWRTILGSASGDPSAKPWAFEAGRRALEDAVKRRGIEADVVRHPRVPGSYYVRREVKGRPLVSAIIPFRDEPSLLVSCYRAFVTNPGHDEFELLLVDNDSALPETRAAMTELARDRRVRLLEAPGPFNWVKINNEAVEKARGDLLLFLNNDVEARSPRWLAHMVAQAQREDVGAVGARLMYPDGTVQHGGVAVGVCWGAAHVQQGIEGHRPGYLSSLSVVRNTSAVTGACMMSRREVFESLEGFDESLPVAFNDIDYCLRVREKDLLVIYTPLAELVHHESKSRGHTDDAKELPYFRSRWRDLLLEGDPYYNPNLGRFDSFCRLPHEEDEERWETFRSMLNKSSTS
jgi:GT2 family glycosyltransferase